MLFIHLYEIFFFFYFLCFSVYNNVYFKVSHHRTKSVKSKTLFLKTITKTLDFLKRQLLFNETLETRKLLFLANKLMDKIPDPCNSKAHYQSFIRNKNTKSVKQSKNSYLTTKNFWKHKHCLYKINYYTNPKPSHKLLKTIKRAEKVGFNSSLYSDTKE